VRLDLEDEGSLGPKKEPESGPTLTEIRASKVEKRTGFLPDAVSDVHARFRSGGPERKTPVSRHSRISMRASVCDAPSRLRNWLL
jgi:hypothetical protein